MVWGRLLQAESIREELVRLGMAEEAWTRRRVLRVDYGVRARITAGAMIRNQLGKFSMPHGKKIAELEFRSRFS